MHHYAHPFSAKPSIGTITKYILLHWFICQLKFNICVRCDMAFIEPMHRNKSNITYLHWFILGCSELTLLMLKLQYSGSTRSIPWLLMTWRRKEPGHQQPWYWLCMINKFSSSMRKNYYYLMLFHLQEMIQNDNISIFMFPEIYLGCRGLIHHMETAKTPCCTLQCSEINTCLYIWCREFPVDSIPWWSNPSYECSYDRVDFHRDCSLVRVLKWSQMISF